MTRTQFIEFVAKIAIQDWVERKICIPSIVIAQAIKESGWGTSELAVNANALFGIKQNGWTGEVYYKVATEQSKNGDYHTTPNKVPWRKYKNWEESVIDHNTYLATRYVDESQRKANLPNFIKVVGERNYVKAIHALQTAKYPYSSSLTYETSIINLYIKKYNLSKYDEEAFARENGSNVVTYNCPFRIRVKSAVHIFSGTTGAISKILGVKPGVYTIVATDGIWGKLKSGAGWVSLVDTNITIL